MDRIKNFICFKPYTCQAFTKKYDLYDMNMAIRIMFQVYFVFNLSNQAFQGLLYSRNKF